MKRLCLFVAIMISVTMAATRIVPAQGDPDQETTQPQKPVEENPKAEPAEQEAAEMSADEKAIHENVVAFVKAYNAGDAKAIAALFAPEGQVITEEGESVEGREAIEAAFQQLFEDMPKTEMEVFIDSIRSIGTDLAVEVGGTRETIAPGETPEYGRYTVLHVKRDGKWLMAMARDTAGEPPTNHERLEPLAWLVGEWLDDGGSSVVRTHCDWSPDGNFLLQEMTIQVEGQDVMQVTQRIGWDPIAKRIRSWVFDSEGGFGEGIWTRLDDSWVIKSTGVQAEGTTASATSVIVPTGTDGYVWRVHDRISGDEALPPLEVKVVRKPPTPGVAGQ